MQHRKCCEMLEEKIDHCQIPTSANMLQDNVGICCFEMLRAFGRALILKPQLSGHDSRLYFTDPKYHTLVYTQTVDSGR